MRREPARLLKAVEHLAISGVALMVVGIVSLMILARGNDEDIAGIVAPALLLGLVAGVVAIATAVLQRSHERAR